MLAKEDCVALAANIMAEERYRSIVATVDMIGLGIKSPENRHTLPEVEIYNFSSLREYLRFMRSEKPDIVFGNARTVVGLTASFFGRRSVFMNHHSSLPKKWWQRIVLKVFLPRFDAIKADTEAEKRELLKLGTLDAKKISIIPIPIDHKFLGKKPAQDYLRALRKRYGIEDGEKVLLFLSVLREHKRPDTILKALKLLRDQNIRVKLLQVGKDVLKERIGKSFGELATKLGVTDSVVSTGRVSDEDLQAFLHLADVGIQSSDAEGQCIVAFEYAAAGLPECLSNLHSFEIFGGNVLRHEPGDAEKLAKNLEYYLTHPAVAKVHAKKNQALVRKQYDYDLIKGKMRAFILGKKPAAVRRGQRR